MRLLQKAVVQGEFQHGSWHIEVNFAAEVTCQRLFVRAPARQLDTSRHNPPAGPTMSDCDNRRERSVDDQQRDLLFREDPVEANPRFAVDDRNLYLFGTDETLVACELLQRLAEIRRV
jgi:hypothetical protein